MSGPVVSGSSRAKRRRGVAARAVGVVLAVALTLVSTASLPAYAAPKLKATPTPTISGIAKAGKTLTAKPGTWKPSDVQFSYQWLRDGKEIRNATQRSYTLTNADASTKISVRVKGKKSGYSSVTRTSAKKVVSGIAVLSGIKDENLRACIADAVGKPKNTISASKVAAVKQLDCSDRGIRTLSGMPKFPNLTGLWLNENNLINLKGMPGLPKLEVFSVIDNRLTSLTGFRKSPKLKELSLNWNQLSTLAGLPNLPQLRRLEVRNNVLTTVKGWPALPKLSVLGLESNRLTTVASLASRTTLTYINLTYNPFKDRAAEEAALRKLTDRGCMILWDED